MDYITLSLSVSHWDDSSWASVRRQTKTAVDEAQG